MQARRPRRRLAEALWLVALASAGLAACSSPKAGSGTGVPNATTAGGAMVDGGTAYFAEQPEPPPDYIFPLVSGQYFTVRTQPISRPCLYEPLYWFGDKAGTSVDYAAVGRERSRLQRRRPGRDDHAQALRVVGR